MVDVSINWATDRNWQTKLLDTWKVAQLNLLRKECVKTTVDRLKTESFIS